MTDPQHPITLPYDQVYKWWAKECNLPPSFFYEKLYYVAKKAARWGADVELEACCEWLLRNGWAPSINRLRAARRPKPKSLAEEATLELDEAAMRGDCVTTTEAMPVLRRALKRLQELEGQSDD